MYNVLIDTTNQHFILILFKDKKIVDQDIRQNWKKNADLLPTAFKKLLSKNNININQIDNYFITNGPGSFTGSRVGLVFAKTLVQLTKAKLFVTSSLKFLAYKGFNGNINLDARSNLIYTQFFKNGISQNEPKLVKKESSKLTEYPFKELASSFHLFLHSFSEVNNFLTVMPYYIKSPNLIKKVF